MYNTLPADQSHILNSHFNACIFLLPGCGLPACSAHVSSNLSVISDLVTFSISNSIVNGNDIHVSNRKSLVLILPGLSLSTEAGRLDQTLEPTRVETHREYYTCKIY